MLFLSGDRSRIPTRRTYLHFVGKKRWKEEKEMGNGCASDCTGSANIFGANNSPAKNRRGVFGTPDENRSGGRGNNFFIKIRRHNSRPDARPHNNWPPSKAETPLRPSGEPFPCSITRDSFRATGNRYRGSTKIEVPRCVRIERVRVNFESSRKKRERVCQKLGDIL